jgi:hypothetical protein
MAETTTLTFGSPATSITLVCSPSLPAPPLSGVPGGSGDATGQLLWPGARALCRTLLAFCPEVRGAVCVELGCGSGAVSAVAAALCGAALVVATDGAPAALPLAAATLASNAVPPSSGAVALLPWGAENVAPLVERHLGGRRCRVVLAAEAVYPASSDAAIDALLATALALLDSADPDACFLMSYVPRAPQATQRLCDAAWRGGWAWEALGTAAPRGEGEAGAVVLRLTVAPRPPRAGGAWAEGAAAMMDAAFPGARESARAAQEYAEEAAEERRVWGLLP